MTVLGKRGVMGNLLIEAESGKLAPGQMHLQLLVAFAQGGGSVTSTWKRWVIVGAKAGEPIDPGLTTQVTWSIDGNSLRRSEMITAAKPIRVRRFWVALPSTANRIETS